MDNYLTTRKLRNYYSDVLDFWKRFELPYKRTIADLGSAGATLSANCIREEMKEYIEAKTKVDELDAIIDWLYVTLGGMCACGLNPERFDYVRWSKVRGALDLSSRIIIAFEKRPLPCVATLTMCLPEAAISIGSLGYEKFQLFDGAWNAVHTKNMSKMWDINTSPNKHPYQIRTKLVGTDKMIVWRAEDGKLMKPPNFTPADLTPFV